MLIEKGLRNICIGFTWRSQSYVPRRSLYKHNSNKLFTNPPKRQEMAQCDCRCVPEEKSEFRDFHFKGIRICWSWARLLSRNFSMLRSWRNKGIYCAWSALFFWAHETEAQRHFFSPQLIAMTFKPFGSNVDRSLARLHELMSQEVNSLLISDRSWSLAAWNLMKGCIFWQGHTHFKTAVSGEECVCVFYLTTSLFKSFWDLLVWISLF